MQGRETYALTQSPAVEAADDCGIDTTRLLSVSVMRTYADRQPEFYRLI